MTREEAIKGLKVLAKDFSGYKPNKEMFNMAIKALEHEPCEDAVSREAVCKLIEDRYDFYEGAEYIGDKSRRDELSSLLADIKYNGLLPSATPKTKTGRWNFIGDQMFECTSCGKFYTQRQLENLRVHMYDPELPKYCPACGSYNGGEQ